MVEKLCILFGPNCNISAHNPHKHCFIVHEPNTDFGYDPQNTAHATSSSLSKVLFTNMDDAISALFSKLFQGIEYVQSSLWIVCLLQGS